MGQAGSPIHCLLGVRSSVEVGSCFITLILLWPLFFASFCSLSPLRFLPEPRAGDQACPPLSVFPGAEVLGLWQGGEQCDGPGPGGALRPHADSPASAPTTGLLPPGAEVQESRGSPSRRGHGRSTGHVSTAHECCVWVPSIPAQSPSTV